MSNIRYKYSLDITKIKCNICKKVEYVKKSNSPNLFHNKQKNIKFIICEKCKNTNKDLICIPLVRGF